MLSINDLCVNYGQAIALEGASISLTEGQVFCVIGPNGAGKSTLLKAIIGLEPVKSGSIRFGDLEIQDMPAYLRARLGIGYVPEGRRLFPDLTVDENIRIGSLSIPSKENIKESMERVLSLFPDLEPKLKTRASLLSGGQQQMVAIARALVSRPRLLLLDEPSTGLMPTVVRLIFDHIKKLRGQHTILIVEQNASAALPISDQAVVLESGRVVLEGPAADLVNNENVRRVYLGL